MDMFNYYYPDGKEASFEDLVDEADFNRREQEEERMLEEMEIVWSIKDFADQVQKHGILEMGRLLIEEMRKRGCSN